MTNHVERAFRAWPVLTDLARRPDRTITYAQLAGKLGIHHRVVRYVLGVIQDYCMMQHLPPLTILVVNSQSGEPGQGFIAWDHDDLERGRSEVRRYPWKNLSNPFAYASDGTDENALVTKLVRQPEKAGEVYAKVKVRGMAQVIFRKALLRVYGSRCAICGLTFEEALEAAHIVPWNKATPKQRLDITNGLLLCANHHRLFDAGLLTITVAGRVHYADPTGTDGSYSRSDRSVSLEWHGKPAFLPGDAAWKPSRDALAWHHRLVEELTGRRP